MLLLMVRSEQKNIRRQDRPGLVSDIFNKNNKMEFGRKRKKRVSALVRRKRGRTLIYCFISNFRINYCEITV